MSIPLTGGPRAGADGGSLCLQRAPGSAVKILQRPEELAALAGAWDRLAEAQAGGPMQYAAWAQAYAAIVDAKGEAAENADEAVDKGYAANLDDEFVLPAHIREIQVERGHAIIVQ